MKSNKSNNKNNKNILHRSHNKNKATDQNEKRAKWKRSKQGKQVETTSTAIQKENNDRQIVNNILYKFTTRKKLNQPKWKESKMKNKQTRKASRNNLKSN